MTAALTTASLDDLCLGYAKFPYLQANRDQDCLQLDPRHPELDRRRQVWDEEYKRRREACGSVSSDRQPK